MPELVGSRVLQTASKALEREAFKGSLRMEMKANQLMVPWWEKAFSKACHSNFLKKMPFSFRA